MVSIQLSGQDLKLNRRPDLGILAEPAEFLIQSDVRWNPFASWLEFLQKQQQAREEAIDREAGQESGSGINPVTLFRKLDQWLKPESVLVADGGDFVGTAAYTLRPRSPLSWLDPGVFGTLGVGGGFALGAACCRPESEVWIIYGDGSSAYSLAEIDTMVRHRLPAIALIGNDAGWAQIARDQVEILKSPVATELRHSHYEKVAHAFGGEGRMVSTLEEFGEAVKEARETIAKGLPYVINARLQKSDFRKGSMSM